MCISDAGLCIGWSYGVQVAYEHRDMRTEDINDV